MSSAHTRDADAAADQRARQLAAAAKALTAAEGTARAAGNGPDSSGGTPRRLEASRRPVAPPSPDPAGEDREPDPEEVARAIVLKQLSMAPRSRQQLADKLRQRNCPDDVATRVLDRMEAVGLVDDEAYAKMVVRSKQATRGLAKRALAHELRDKGVADATIDDALGSIDAESERALAEQVAQKTMRRLAGLDPQVQARRLSGVLGRKGYPPSVVYAVVRDAVNDAPEHQRD
ncbi:MAG TPA: regulatory protein RecX [Lapillicoccus sp.]